MGCRVWKIENEEHWIVYQSTSWCCFVPIFDSEIKALLFAHWYQNRSLIPIENWEDWAQENLAAAISSFIEARPVFEDCHLAFLYNEFLEWRSRPKSPPEQKPKEKPTNV